MGQRIPVSRSGPAVTAILLLVFSGCSFGFLSDKTEGQSFVVNLVYPLDWQEFSLTSESSEARFLTRSSNRILMTLLVDDVVRTSRNINIQFDDSINALTGRAEFRDLPFGDYEVRAEAFSENNVLQAHAVDSVTISSRVPVDLNLVLMPHESLVVDIPLGFHYSAAAFLEDYMQASVAIPQLAAGSVRHFRFSVSASDVELIDGNAVFVFAGDFSALSNPLLFSLRDSTGRILSASTQSEEDPDDDLVLTFITPGSPLSPGVYYVSLFNNTNAALSYVTASGYSGEVDSDFRMDLPFEYFNNLSAVLDGDNLIFSADYNGPVTDNLDYYIAWVSDTDKGLHGPFDNLPVSLAESEFTEDTEIDWKVVAVLGNLESGVMHDSSTQSYIPPAPDTFTVTLDAQGGTVTPETIEVTYDQPYGDLPDPVREGYNFIEWNTASDGSGETVTEITVVSALDDHTLFALWDGAELTVTIDLINPEEADITFSDTSETLSASGSGYPAIMTITVVSSDTIDSYTWLLNGESGNPALTVSPGDIGDHVVELDAAEGLYFGVHNLSLFVVINGNTFSAQFDFSVVQ